MDFLCPLQIFQELKHQARGVFPWEPAHPDGSHGQKDVNKLCPKDKNAFSAPTQIHFSFSLEKNNSEAGDLISLYGKPSSQEGAQTFHDSELLRSSVAGLPRMSTCWPSHLSSSSCGGGGGGGSQMSCIDKKIRKGWK